MFWNFWPAFIFARGHHELAVNVVRKLCQAPFRRVSVFAIEAPALCNRDEAPLLKYFKRLRGGAFADMKRFGRLSHRIGDAAIVGPAISGGDFDIGGTGHRTKAPPSLSSHHPMIKSDVTRVFVLIPLSAAAHARPPRLKTAFHSSARTAISNVRSCALDCRFSKSLPCDEPPVTAQLQRQMLLRLGRRTFEHLACKLFDKPDSARQREWQNHGFLAGKAPAARPIIHDLMILCSPRGEKRPLSSSFTGPRANRAKQPHLPVQGCACTAFRVFSLALYCATPINGRHVDQICCGFTARNLSPRNVRCQAQCLVLNRLRLVRRAGDSSPRSNQRCVRLHHVDAAHDVTAVPVFFRGRPRRLGAACGSGGGASNRARLG